jgi:hypothetical protein
VTKFIIIAVVVVLAGVGYVAMGGSGKNQPPPPKTSDKPTPPELVRVTDTANLYSIELPEGWVTTHEGPRGVRLSGLHSESPDWSASSGAGDGPSGMVTYEHGAVLNISVTSETLSEPYHESSSVLSQSNISVGDVEATIHNFREPSLAEGTLLDAHLQRNGHYYVLRFGYNPATYSQGEEVFRAMLDSVRFTN